MKNFNYSETTIAITLAIAMAVSGFIGYLCGNSNEPAEPVVKYVEVVKQDAFDTSVIEQEWCGGFTDGTIRMVGAWWYADGVVEDEQGQLWGIEQSIEQTDFLLLWIADNNTPDNTTDDLIIKVWREAY